MCKYHYDLKMVLLLYKYYFVQQPLDKTTFLYTTLYTPQNAAIQLPAAAPIVQWCAPIGC